MNSLKIPTIGQRNLIPLERYERAFREIFSNRYYTNHGPFVRELEAKVQELLKLRHAIAMTNEDIAAIIAIKAMNLQKCVICSELAPVSVFNALSWNGVLPMPCATSKGTIDVKSLESMIDGDVCGICVSSLEPCLSDIDSIDTIAQKHNVPYFFESFSSFGASIKSKMLGGFGAFEIFSLSENELVNAGEGAVVCTNDDELAKRIRNIRSSYGAGEQVKVPNTGNGRMSEAQAALALASIEEMDENLLRNKYQHDLYTKEFADTPIIELLQPCEGYKPTFSAVTFSIATDCLNLQLMSKFEHLRVRSPAGEGIYSELPTYKNNEALYQLPTGKHVTESDIFKWCKQIKEALIAE